VREHLPVGREGWAGGRREGKVCALLARPAREDELPQLLRLYADLHEHDSPAPPQELEQVWQSMLDHPGLQVLVAEVDGEVVSTCTLAVVPNLTRGARPYGVIENVVTRAEYRRRGFGTEIVRAALRRAWDEGCYKVMLLTSRTEEATLRFYQQAGLQRGVKSGFVAYRDLRSSTGWGCGGTRTNGELT
jgi:GNAT superfamily N-acetyltransferase